jgi:hypothetical protein
MENGVNSLVRHVPQWFISVFALTYLTGFLIDSIYYSSVGIIDVGEVIKLRHVQLGLLFLMLFLTVTVPLYFLGFNYKKMVILGESNPNELPPMTPIMALTSVLFFGTIYYVIAVVPPGFFYFKEHPWRLGGFFGLLVSIVGGYIGVMDILARRRRVIENKHPPGDGQRAAALENVAGQNKKRQIWFLRFMFIYLLLADYFLFQDLITDFIHSLWPYGVFFFGFCLIFTAQLARLVRRLEMDKDRLDKFAKIGLVSLGGVGLLIVYYATVAAFAYTIFPYIPSSRGGAKYTDAHAYSIVVDRTNWMRNPNFVADTDGRIDNLILLYSTTDSFYFGVCDWRNTEDIKTKGPAAILEVRRDEIKYLDVSAAVTPQTKPQCPAAAASGPN